MFKNFGKWEGVEEKKKGPTLALGPQPAPAAQEQKATAVSEPPTLL